MLLFSDVVNFYKCIKYIPIANDIKKFTHWASTKINIFYDRPFLFYDRCFLNDSSAFLVLTTLCASF